VVDGFVMESYRQSKEVLYSLNFILPLCYESAVFLFFVYTVAATYFPYAWKLFVKLLHL